MSTYENDDLVGSYFMALVYWDGQDTHPAYVLFGIPLQDVWLFGTVTPLQKAAVSCTQ